MMYAGLATTIGRRSDPAKPAVGHLQLVLRAIRFYLRKVTHNARSPERAHIIAL